MPMQSSESPLTALEAPPSGGSRLLNAAERGGFAVRDVSVSESTLENVFIHLTGKDLRD